MVADGRANIGSSNFDHRSFDLDDELDVAFTDAGLVGALDKNFLTDLDLSEEIDLAGWRKQLLRRRVVEHAADLARQSLLKIPRPDGTHPAIGAVYGI